MSNEWVKAKHAAEDMGYLPGSNDYYSFALSFFKERSYVVEQPIDGDIFFTVNPHIPKPGSMVGVGHQREFLYVPKSDLKIEVL
jgi:hypothetical protein